jgi:hypothetical protein
MHGNPWVDTLVAAALRIARERSGRLVALSVALPPENDPSELAALRGALHSVEVVPGPHARLVAAEFER